jgi:SAM-dependent methyltransferase
VTELPSDTAEIVAFYSLGLERDRLTTGQGALELARTRALLERHLPAPPAEILDAGGGPGRYAVWLAARGYRVHLLDLVSLHIEQARVAASARPETALASAEVGDTRVLPRSAESMDAVLLLGPLYHLTETSERVRALREARRVCRRGGVVIAAVISRYASTLDGIRGSFVDDPTFAAVTADARRNGQHRNPTRNPACFTTAYFHRPGELEAEFAAAGLIHEATLGVEGPAWFLNDLDARLADERRRTALLDALAAIEAEPTLLGASAHWLGIARRV